MVSPARSGRTPLVWWVLGLLLLPGCLGSHASAGHSSVPDEQALAAGLATYAEEVGDFAQVRAVVVARVGRIVFQRCYGTDHRMGAQRHHSAGRCVRVADRRGRRLRLPVVDRARRRLDDLPRRRLRGQLVEVVPDRHRVVVTATEVRLDDPTSHGIGLDVLESIVEDAIIARYPREQP